MTDHSLTRAAATSRLLAWLRPVVVVCDAVAIAISWLTTPIDREARDRAAEDVLAESLTGGAVERIVAAIERMFAGSLAIRWMRSASMQFMAMPRNHRVRAMAGVALAAAATVLLLRLLQLPPTPYSWIVPAIVLGVSALVLLTARRESRIG